MNELDVISELMVRGQGTWIELDHIALKHNLAQILSLTVPRSSVMAVVKANAYGHGLIEMADCLKDAVSYFGVASIEEAVALRDSGISTPVLLFGIPPRDAVKAAIQEDIALAVSSPDQAREISECARRLGRSATLHIKVDTGMGRLGLSAAQAFKEIRDIGLLDKLELEGIFTHFPQGEDPEDPFTQGQIHSFKTLIEQLENSGIHFAFRHAANSTGIANHPDAHFNLVRPGISLYGIFPNLAVKSRFSLKPVLSWRARVLLVKQLMPGESTGYGRTFVAGELTTIAILPVGYSHGYPFALSNKSVVLYQGKPYPVAGRISMDYLSVNFGTEPPKVKPGDLVTILGREGEQEVSAEYLAQAANTIPYEIVTQINPSIPRIVI